MQKRLAAVVLAVLLALVVGVARPAKVSAMDDCQYLMGALSAAQADLDSDYANVDGIVAMLDDPSTDPSLIPLLNDEYVDFMDNYIPQDNATVNSLSDQAKAAHCY